VHTPTLPRWLEALEKKYRHLPALKCGDLTVSFAELSDRSRSIATGLSRNGIIAGDRVAIWLLNETDWISIFLACAHIGAIAVAVNTRYRATELADIFGRVRPKAVFFRSHFRSVDFSEQIDRASLLSGAAPALLVTLGDDAAGSSISLDDLIGEPQRSVLETIDGNSGAIMFSTSGTTSAPKFVTHPHRSIVDHAGDVADNFGMTATDTVMLQALPYCGVFGFCQAMAALDAGQPSIVLDVFEAKAAAAAIADNRVTHFNATDEMLTALVGAAPADALSTLRLVGAASFNRGPETLDALADTYGIPIVGLYGMSEVQALFARRDVDDPSEQRFRAGGHPVSHRARARVCDPETRDILPIGEYGELELSGPSQLTGYFGDEAATHETLTADGFVRTGDLGVLSEDGSFTFESRLGDALRLGGFLVNPDEISEFVENIDGIEECVVVGVMSGGRLRPAAFVKTVLLQSLDPETALDICRHGLAPFKVPVVVHALDEFPVADGPNGVKIQRGVLRELAGELVEE
jgi:fatty-acyl-CoA synthase